MNSLDLFAAIAIGVFLTSVAWNGNSQRMLDLAARDKDFLLWGISVALLKLAYDMPELRGPVSIIAGMTFLGFAYNNMDAIMRNGEKFLTELGVN